MTNKSDLVKITRNFRLKHKLRKTFFFMQKQRKELPTPSALKKG